MTTFPHSLWCTGACSVYNITTRKCRVVLSLWSVFKGHTEQPQLSLFYLAFPPSCKTQLADLRRLHPSTACADNAGRTGAAVPVFLRVQSGWVRGDGGTRGMFESRLGCPTGRVGELREVRSPLAVKRLHTVIWGWRLNSLSVVEVRYDNIHRYTMRQQMLIWYETNTFPWVRLTLNTVMLQIDDQGSL